MSIRVFLTMDMNVNVADVASFRRFESGQAAVGGMTTADDVALCSPPVLSRGVYWCILNLHCVGAGLSRPAFAGHPIDPLARC